MKKIAVTLMALAVSALIFAGCKSTSNNSIADTTTGTTTNVTVTTVETTAT